jgi:chromosome segregation ATPase
MREKKKKKKKKTQKTFFFFFFFFFLFAKAKAALGERDAALAQLRSVKDEFQHYKADLALMGAENERMQQELRDARARLRGASGQMESVRDDQALQVQALRQSLRALNDHLLVCHH